MNITQKLLTNADNPSFSVAKQGAADSSERDIDDRNAL
jgi:hypothetical protein